MVLHLFLIWILLPEHLWSSSCLFSKKQTSSVYPQPDLPNRFPLSTKVVSRQKLYLVYDVPHQQPVVPVSDSENLVQCVDSSKITFLKVRKKNSSDTTHRSLLRHVTGLWSRPVIRSPDRTGSPLHRLEPVPVNHFTD
jgi:hypothetical protein